MPRSAAYFQPGSGGARRWARSASERLARPVSPKSPRSKPEGGTVRRLIVLLGLIGTLTLAFVATARVALGHACPPLAAGPRFAQRDPRPGRGQATAEQSD
jgi:hypothetical protein